MVLLMHRLLFSSRSRRGGRRPEAFLTPYEMEMVPLMLKELRALAPRFFETVAFRWFREAMSSAASRHPTPKRSIAIDNRATSSASQSAISMPLRGKLSYSGCTASTLPATMYEFENEGVALEELVRRVARSLAEVGAFDDACEAAVCAYRRKREAWRCASSVAASAATTLAAPTLLRSRSFSAAVAAPPIVAAVARCGSRAFVLARNDDSVIVDNDDDEDEDEPNGQNSVSTAARRLSARLGRLMLQRSRRRCARRATELVFVQLGEVLVNQYLYIHNNIDRDGGSVHERELKLLIWRHFVQMLVSVLTDRARFPNNPKV